MKSIRTTRTTPTRLWLALVCAMGWGCGGAGRSQETPNQFASGGTSGGATTTAGAGAPSTEGAPIEREATAAGGSSTGASPMSGGGVAPMASVGFDAEHPVMRCGPRDSYFYVASQYQCPDGSNPLNGDLALGQRSRQGNVGANSTGHIIDLYVVPCASGPQQVYVDMYGCNAGP